MDKKTKQSPTLQEIRNTIDGVDDQLLSLITKRAHLNKQVFEAKNGAAVYRPERERQILSRLISNNKNGLQDTQISNIFTEIISACRSLQKKLHVLYLGPKGTFSYEATVKHFGSNITFTAEKNVADVFDQMARNSEIDYAVVPIENSLQGCVHSTLESLIQSQLFICSELELPIHHHLITQAKTPSEIKKIASHPQALLQCKDWLRQHLPDTIQESTNSTTAAIEKAKRDSSIAAIGSALGSKLFDVPILESQIQESIDNVTRFVILGRCNSKPSGKDKTSLFLQLNDQPGALCKVLQCFNANSINMKKIESYPAKREKWTYVFFIDIEGHIDESPVQNALKNMQPWVLSLKVLGSYACFTAPQ